VIAQSLKDLPVDRDAAALLGILPLDGTQSSIADRGLDNRPLNSNEIYNNPETVSKDCEKRNTGDYCFENRTRTSMQVKINPHLTSSFHLMTLSVGQKQCFYNLNADNWDYQIFTGTQGNFPGEGKGQILVIKCKSKSFVIR